ncbi:MAG: ribosome silencing factor [Bacteroidota bacterium]|jgi:ribosome-associated protein
MAKKTGNETEALAMVAVKGMQDKKAHDIVTLDLRKLKGAFADMMVICHGNSDRQVSAIADGVEDEIRLATGEKPLHREGGEHAEWVLLDYVNVVIHVFLEEKRRFYGIEDLWGDAEVRKFEDPV